LDHPAASPGNIGGRQWNGFAEGVESLLDPFSNGWLVLNRFFLLAAEGPQAGPEHGAGSYCCGAEGEHGCNHGEEHDNDKD
jgi:hypothetical protein